MMTKKQMITNLCVGLCAFFLAAPVQARQWQGAFNDDWGEAANWFPAGVPSAAEFVEFSFPSPNTTIELVDNRSTFSAFFSSNADYSIIEGVADRALTLTSGDLSALGIGSHRLQHVKLGADGTWSVNNPQVEVSGYLEGPRLTKTGSGILLLTGGSSGDPSTLETLRGKGGTVIISGEDGGGRIDLTSTNFSLTTPAMSTDGGDITIRNGADVRMPTNTKGYAFINNGTLTVTGSGTSLIGSRLDAAEHTDHSGSIVIKSGASLALTKNFYSGYFGDGDTSVESGADVSASRVGIGMEPSSSSSLSVKGDETQLTARGQLYLGGEANSILGGTGVLTITDDGSAQAEDTKFWSSSSSIIVNGGTLETDTLSEYTGVTGLISISDPTGGTALTVGSSDGSTFNGVIQNAAGGAGSLSKIGAGTLTLTGANTYTGGTAIDAGTLQIGTGGTTGSIVGNVANSGALVFDRSNDLTFGGVVSGGGSLTLSGSGSLTLSKANTYTGGTAIDAGTLQVGTGGTSGSIVGNVTNNSALVFDRSNNLTFAGDISGSGSLTHRGDNTLILTGTSTYTGGTVIDSGGINTGTLRVGNGGTTGSIAGNVFNNSTLEFKRSDEVVFGGLISGSGSLTKSGAGSLILTAANTYSGGTTINSGILLANNTTGSATGSGPVYIGNGDTLGGTGSVAGTVTMHANGTVAPGASAGTLTASSSLTLTGTYLCELDGANADQLVVSGALNISAGTLDVDLLGGGATESVYVIATYGSLTGSSFATVTDLPSNYRIDYAYNGNQIALIQMTPFESWADGYDLSGGDALFDADPDNDGGKNGYEWATGTNPTNPASICMLGIGSTNTDAVVTFTRNTNATDVAIELQRSLNLVSNVWSGIATNTAGSWNPPGIVTESGTGNPVDVEITDSHTNAANYRLRVE